MAELLTQLQDQLDSISRKFFEAVGVLQRDAPPVSTSGEALIAATPAPGFDVQATVKRMTEELIAQIKETQELLQLLPDTNPAAAAAATSSGGGMLLPMGGPAQEAAAAAFEADIQQLQAQHEAVSGQLAAAVEEIEALLMQLQQLYAAQAQATLAAGPVPLPPKQQEQGEQGP
jgi:molecular chaperone DnaK (HSP70)